MMDSQAIREIVQLVEEKQTILWGDEMYVPLGYHKLRQVDRTPVVNVSTLSSLVRFIQTNPQDLDLQGAIAVIRDDMSVVVLSKPHEEDKDRTAIIHAKSDYKPFQFNTFHPSELFNIFLQTMFLYNDEAKDLFTVSSKLVIDEGVDLSDDGMTTKVTIKKGMSSASATAVAMPSRVQLRPFRIFTECEQPESNFLIRLKGDKEIGAHVGLWETDGGAWRVLAKKSINDTLVEMGLNIPIYS